MAPWLQALFGGILIGSAAILLLVADGQIAGISGILGRLLSNPKEGQGWRWAFLAGFPVGGLIFHLMGGEVFQPLPGRSWGAVIAAGLLVGLGTQIGSGCTSGHAVCGIGRLSVRSIVATLTFMLGGAVTVYVVQHLLGGSL